MLTLFLAALTLHRTGSVPVNAVHGSHPAFGPLANFTVTPSTIPSGSKAAGVVTLTGPATSPGVFVNISTSNSAIASVPTVVFVSPGDSTSAFTIVGTPGLNMGGSTVITASLGSVTLSQTLNVQPVAPASVTLSPTAVTGGNSSNGTVTLNAIALAGGFTFNLSSDTPGVTVPPTASVVVGASSVTFAVATVPVPVPITATITASANGLQATAILKVNPPALTGVTLSTSSVAGGTALSGTVQLAGIAPAGGIPVAVASNSQSVTITSPVTVPAGVSSATFPISTSAVSAAVNATITASSLGVVQTANLAVVPPGVKGLDAAPPSVAGGNVITGTVTLTGPAPSTPTIVSLLSNTTIASVPPTVTVPTGSSSANFSITTSGVAKISSATITATLGSSSQTVIVTITPATLTEVQITASTPVVGGNRAEGVVNLSGNAPPGGISVSLQSNSPSAKVPPSVTVPAGNNSAAFSIDTSVVAKPVVATVTATFGTQTETGQLTIDPITLTGISLNANSVVGGSDTTITGTLTFNGPTPAAGVVVDLVSSNSQEASVPSSVKVVLTGSARTSTFVVTHLKVATSTTVTLKATAAGVNQSVALMLTPFMVTGLTVSPGSVMGGTAAKGALTLNANPGKKSGPVSVKLSSSHKAAEPPSAVDVAEGTSTVTFSIPTTAVAADTTATIDATLNSNTQQAPLLVSAPVLESISVSPISVKGSATTVVTGVVTLSGPAPSSGLVVSLTSSDASAAATPATVKIEGGKTTASFTVSHKKVSASTTVTLTATLGSVGKPATLTVTP